MEQRCQVTKRLVPRIKCNACFSPAFFFAAYLVIYSSSLIYNVEGQYYGFFRLQVDLTLVNKLIASMDTNKFRGEMI